MRLPHLRAALTLCAAAFIAGCANTPELLPSTTDSNMVSARKVRDAEQAFAQTMERRDHEGFKKFIAADAVFFTGPEPLRGKEAVAAYWKRWYDGPAAPFTWEPREVEVLDNNTLALSKGPVYGADGRPIGSFQSVWRRDPDGEWRVVFDSGCSCIDKR